MTRPGIEPRSPGPLANNPVYKLIVLDRKILYRDYHITVIKMDYYDIQITVLLSKNESIFGIK